MSENIKLRNMLVKAWRLYVNTEAKFICLIDRLSVFHEPPYYCPCCGTRLYWWKRGRYEKHPEIRDPDRYKVIKYGSICPVCNSLQRHRMIVEFFESYKIELKNKRILYFAVEECVESWLRRNRISFTSADLYQQADLRIDIEDTGIPDESYDLIFCNHVLEHVNNYHKALQELYRLLSNDGMLLCSFPIDTSFDTVYEDESIVSKEERIKHFGQDDHKRVFGRDSRDILCEYGFEVTTIDEEIAVSNKILPLPGPADYDLPVVFVCRKRRQ